MLASEVIKRYEAYCPQELSMEEMSVGYRSARYKRHPQGHGGLRYPRADSGRSYRPWGRLDHRQARTDFPSHQGFGSRSGSKSDLYRFDQA